MSERISFLQAVARAYVERHGNLTDICFVFPNKRAGTFFLRNLARESAPRTLIAPPVMSIAEFMEELSDRDVDSRIDMLFRLYNVYCRLMARYSTPGNPAPVMPFDRFVGWGETILGDFSEVDQYMADAGKLFKNVKDYREISSDFLTDSQRQMIERYFGYVPQIEPVEGFWRHAGHGEDVEESELSRKFVELWQLLPELYEGLREDLEAEGLCMPGSAYRLAFERIAGEGIENLKWKKVVFVGFNSISTAENRLFEELLKYPCREDNGDRYAEFFWDCAGPVLGDEKSGAAPELRRNIRNFPAPEWGMEYIEMCDRSEMPEEITICASPSNSAQVKIARSKVASLLESIGSEDIRDARVALVLPDESLLMPLLYSLPPGLGDVNLTMGYSMRYTSVASFMHHLKRLQARRGTTAGEESYYNEDLRLFLSHPLVHVAIGSGVANRINGIIANRHLYWIPWSLLASESSDLGEILRPLPKHADTEQTAAYIDDVLLRIDSALVSGGEADGKVKQRIERTQIEVYRNALGRLMDSVRERGMAMDSRTMFHLVDRLLAGEKITFEGKPLQGLQVMGLLETRALDFDRLIILSMNDKSMPRRGARRTFVPDALRKGYGLPSLRQSETLYSYYFYRMISRACGVDLIYDARAGEGMRRGGKSRFLMQLEMLYASGRTKKENYTYSLTAGSSVPVVIEKTPEIMKHLQGFAEDGGLNFSASALMKYCECPLLFYYNVVKKVSDDVDEKLFIDPVTQGNIIHRVMLHLYLPEPCRNRYLRKRVILEKGFLEALALDEEKISAEIRKAINILFYHKREDLDRELPQGVQLVADRLAQQIRSIVEYDASRAPVTLIGGEIGGKVSFPIPAAADEECPEGMPAAINVTYQFDRVEEAPEGGIRIIDYKTGSPSLQAPGGMEDVFGGDYDTRYILQLLFYSELLRERVVSEEGRDVASVEIHPEIYLAGKMADGAKRASFYSHAKKRPLETYSEWREEFLPRLGETLREIFDPAKPFVGCDDEERCSRCAFRTFCGR